MADAAERNRPEWLTVEQAAEILDLHPKTIRRQLKNGDLPGRKFGRQFRIPASALEATVEPQAA